MSQNINIHTAKKSRRLWTINDLKEHNIHVSYQDAPTFFEVPTLPQPSVFHPDILTALGPEDATIHLRTRDLLSHINFATTETSEESAVNDFMRLLLHEVGYVGDGRLVRSRQKIGFYIGGEIRPVKTNLCVTDRDKRYFLLILEDRKDMGERHLIASAIAAFAANNLLPQETFAQPPLAAKVIAGIVMKRTVPTFYKVNVSTDFVTSIQAGTSPKTPTVVYAYSPTTPMPDSPADEGMNALDTRKTILQCFEAFKKFCN